DVMGLDPIIGATHMRRDQLARRLLAAHHACMHKVCVGTIEEVFECIEQAGLQGELVHYGSVSGLGWSVAWLRAFGRERGPNQTILLVHGIGTGGAGVVGGGATVAGHRHASTLAIEAPAVVGADQLALLYPAFGEWCIAMRAAVLKHANLTMFATEKHQRLAEDLPCQWFPCE